MGKRIIECSVSDEYLLGGGVPIGAAGSHDDVVLRLAFGDTWAGLNIYATFTDALGQQSIVVLLLPSMLVPGEAMTYDVPIPAVAKRESGRMLLGLTGYMIVNGNEDMATHTAEAFFRVLPSKVALADDGSIDATLAQQLQDEVNKFTDIYIEESERQENEIIRQASETEREDAEALRAAAETERVAAEADREDAESAREAAENERVIAEGERDEFIGELDSTVDELLKLQEDILDGRVEEIVPVAYPVGAIYLSVNDTAPAAIFGGTWERLKDRFLLGAGDTFGAGDVGGNTGTMLVKDNLPGETLVELKNTHWADITTYGAVQESQTVTAQYGTIAKVLRDQGQLSPNYGPFVQQEVATMPPYLAVHMWKRIA